MYEASERRYERTTRKSRRAIALTAAVLGKRESRCLLAAFDVLLVVGRDQKRRSRGAVDAAPEPAERIAVQRARRLVEQEQGRVPIRARAKASCWTMPVEQRSTRWARIALQLQLLAEAGDLAGGLPGPRTRGRERRR